MCLTRGIREKSGYEILTETNRQGGNWLAFLSNALTVGNHWAILVLD